MENTALFVTEPLAHFKEDLNDINHNYTKDEKGEKKDLESGDHSKYLITDPQKIKWSVLKNVVCISFAFTLLFTSFYSLVNIQSSVYREMGTRSLGVLYVGLVLSCLFLPTLIIKKLKPKWSVCVAMLMYSPYFASMYYPQYYTFLPSAFLLGLAAAPLWAGKCTYLTKVSEIYGEAVGEAFDVIVVRFFGIFFFFFQTSQIWGNLLSSTILSVGITDFERSEEFLKICGADFCPHFSLEEELGFSNANLSSTMTPSSENMSTISTEITPTEALPPSHSKIYIMTTINLALILSAAAILAFIIDPLSRYGADLPKPSKLHDLVFATFKHMKKPYQLLILPLTIWSGMEQGFLSADYTQSYVTCGIGVHMVGYSFLCYGISDAIFSIAFTPLIKFMNRVPIFTFAALLNVAMVAVMFVWKPHPNHFVVFFVIPTLWGMADAVWQTQINALYGVIFPGESEAAFSNYRLWESIGFILAYIISGYFCMDKKMYIVLASLAIGMVGYYAVEFAEWKRKNKH